MISIFDIYKVTLKHQNAIVSDKIATFARLKVILLVACVAGFAFIAACPCCSAVSCLPWHTELYAVLYMRGCH